MDGVFTTCRGTEGCVRLDGHTSPCDVPVAIRRRSPQDRLRYLAEKLETGTDPVAVAFSLRMMADE